MESATVAPAPYFHAIASFTWGPHRLYRVYVRGRELFFVYLGSTITMSPATAAQFGLAGAVAGAALAAGAARQREQLRDQVEEKKEAPLEEVLKLHKHSFSAHPDDLETASLEPFGFWRKLTYRKEKQTGLFKFRHRHRGNFTLEFPTADDLRKAGEWLPAALGPVLQVRLP